MNFASYLHNSLNAKGISAYSFCKLLVGTKISRSSFYDYLRGTSVPSFEKAYQIMEIIDIPFDQEELLSVLNESIPETILSEKFCGSFKIPYYDLGVEPEQLEYRINETSSGVNDYIKKLIKKDLKESILMKGEDYE